MDPANFREPAPSNYPRIRLGDVGFIRDGQFHLLFSAGCQLGGRQPGSDVPDTFEELTVGTPVFRQPLVPGCLRTATIRELRASVGVGVSPTLYVEALDHPLLIQKMSPRPVEPSANFSFELTGNRGAALVTKYPSYREDSQLRSAFAGYTKRHYKSWVKFARDKQYGDDVKPVLVCGFDMTRDFAMVAYSHEDTSVGGDFTIAVPALGSASASVWGTWRTRCSPHTNYGPQMCHPPTGVPTIGSSSSGGAGTGSIPDEFNQCVFIRYYTMRSKIPMFPEVIRAGAGPHDLGPGENRGDTFPKLAVQLVTEDVDSETDIVVRNTPLVWHLPSHKFATLIFFPIGGR